MALRDDTIAAYRNRANTNVESDRNGSNDLIDTLQRRNTPPNSFQINDMPHQASRPHVFFAAVGQQKQEGETQLDKQQSLNIKTSQVHIYNLVMMHIMVKGHQSTIQMAIPCLNLINGHLMLVDVVLYLIMERWDLEDMPATEKKILDIARERYRGWRSTLHSTYKAYNTDEERRRNRPEDVDPDEWEWLIEYFGTYEKFQELSQKNSKNRKKQKTKHLIGSKSYSRISFEKRNVETGEEPDDIQLWELTHVKNGQWSTSESQVVFLTMHVQKLVRRNKKEIRFQKKRGTEYFRLAIRLPQVVSRRDSCMGEVTWLNLLVLLKYLLS